MSIKTDSYSTRLINLYSKWGDVDSIRQVESLMKEEEVLNQIRIVKDNPQIRSMIASAIDRWRGAMVKLTTKRNMTDLEREVAFIDMDWAQWYLNSLGGDVKKAQEEIERSLELKLNEMEDYEKSRGTR